MIPLARNIETHPDFRLVADAVEMIDPEIREKRTITVEQIHKLEEQADKPIRDFIWNTSSDKQKISEMDTEALLTLARHCISRANLYADKVHFFLNVLEIAEQHAEHKGVEIPHTIEELEAALELLQTQQTEPEQDFELSVTAQPEPEKRESVPLKQPSAEFMEQLKRDVAANLPQE